MLPVESVLEAGGLRYDLFEEIARGGMGVVYRAIQHGSQRQVAVKMILAEEIATLGMMERFRAEAEAIASLDHPHILPIYEIGESEGRPFYSMKFASGGTLRDHQGQFGEFRAAAQLIATVAHAVHHAHERGILHRDLKPGNILLDGAEQTPYVTDFGIAKWIGRDRGLTLFPTALGTPHYVAPEQAAGDSASLTTAADIYSLGAILYELLAGRPPFDAESPLETLRLSRDTAPVPLRDLVPAVPRDLEVICLKCLAKEPAARYRSAASLAEDLERWLAGRTILARPSTRVERGCSWAKRNPALATLSGALLLAVVALAVGSTIAAARLSVSNRRAVAAEHAAREELRSASLAQARATRRGGRMGQRFDTMSALQRAAGVRPGADLRTEALAALMLPDLRIDRDWGDRHAPNSPAAFDSTLNRYVAEVDAGVLSVRRTTDQSNIARLPAPEGNPRVLYIAPLSSDDRRIAARYANDVVRVYEMETGRMAFELSNRPVCANGRAFAYDFGFTPDGRELAVGLPGGGVSFHDGNDGHETGRLITPTIPAVIAFSPDGRKVALVAKKGTDIEVYDRKSGQREQTLNHPSFLHHVAWRPGSSQHLAAACNDDNLYLWNTTTGRPLRILQGHEGFPGLLAFHPAGKILASTARDNTVRFWDVESGAGVLTAGLYGEPCLRFSADGQRLATGGTGTGLSTARVVLDAPCREFYRCALSDWYSRISGISLSKDGQLMVIGLQSDGLHLFSTESGKILADLPIFPGEMKTAAFAPRGDALIYSGKESGLWKRTLRWREGDSIEVGPAELVDARPGFLLTDIVGDPPVVASYGESIGKFTLVPLADPGQAVDFSVASKPAGAFLSPDLRFVATNDWVSEDSHESDARLWDARTGQLVRRLEAGPNNSVRISPSGRWLVACGVGPGAGLWELPQLTRKLNVEVGEDAWFTPDEKMLVALNGDCLGLVRISDGQLQGCFPSDPTMAVAFAPDGQKMFVGYSTHFYEWDLPAVRRELRTIGLDWDEGL
jgi:WD40 repeat protein